MINIGIVGATGYTGVELVRLLINHPEVNIQQLTSRSEAGRNYADIFPAFRGLLDRELIAPDPKALAECDLVFSAAPHGVAQAMVADLIGRGVKVIDLSADFRLYDTDLWAEWYGQPHVAVELQSEAVYGLPEVNREKIRHARLIACPGCYPTSIQLGLIPLLEQGLVEPQSLIANAASGVSGAGRSAKVDNLFAEVADSFKAYAGNGHRHLPEIEQGLRQVQAADSIPAEVTFVPHLLPMIRGIHASLYASLNDAGRALGQQGLQALFESRFGDEPFVDVMPAGTHPQTRSVKGTNLCRLSVFLPQKRDKVVILSVIDNLTKGAAGQAVQNMNIMFGFAEKQGLGHPALTP